MTTCQSFGDVPFRIRVGVVGDASSLDESVLRPEIVKLFDEESQKLLREAKHTTLEFHFDALNEENLTEADVLLVYENCSHNATNLLALARKQGRPIISVTDSKPPGLSVEKGHGLNAHLVRALDRFNGYAISEGQQQSYVENFYKDFFRPNDGIPNYLKYVIRANLLPYYVRASLLAKSNQKTYRHAGVLVYSFSALAVGAVAIGTLVHALAFGAFAVELVLLLAILSTILHANHKRAHKNWIQARYVAERIRAAIVLTTCGVETSVIALPANVGVTGKPEQWMVMAFNEITRRLPSMSACHGLAVQTFVAFVRNHWLEQQIAFHSQKADKAKKMNHWLEWIGIILFSAAVLAAGLHLLLAFLHIEWAEHPLTFAAIFLPAAGASIGGIRTHREYSRLAIRSSNMAASLKVLNNRLSAVSTPKELESVLVQVEELTLLELQDWLMLMSVVKLEAA
jgi:SMODS and SLOG-associating 2TM effector domain 1